MNLASIIDDHPADAVALVSRGKVTTYGELRAQVAGFRGGLVGLGLRPGDRLALLCANNWYFVVSYLAGLSAGLVVVPLNPLSPARELQRELRSIDARAVVVGPSARASFARGVGADETVLLDGFKQAVTELTGGRGVDVVLDVVGGEVFTDSLRCLAEQGRLLVVGFASGQGIPEVKVNRLLLGNIDVRGVGWGAFARTKPTYLREQWDRLQSMLQSGAVSPPIGATYELADFGRALQEMADRRTLGKSVVRVR